MPVPPPPNAKKVHQGKMATVYEWPQELYDGSTATYECYVRQDTVAVIAFLDRETLLLIKQEQPGRASSFVDPPGGLVDPGETAEQAAHRELFEETGYHAEKLMLWCKDRYEGITRFEEFTFVATGLTHAPDGNPDAPGEKITLQPTSWKEAVKLSLDRKMRRNDSMLAILGMEFDPEQRARLDAFLK